MNPTEPWTEHNRVSLKRGNFPNGMTEVLTLPNTIESSKNVLVGVGLRIVILQKLLAN